LGKLVFWNDENEQKLPLDAPEDVFDIVFKLGGKCLDIDHAYDLSQALSQIIPEEFYLQLGVHQIRMAESGNGWNRPMNSGSVMQLSRRAKLVIRADLNSRDAVVKISGKTLKLGAQQINIGESSIRKLSMLGTLFSHAITCEESLSEEHFLAEVARQLESLNISVSKMICGRTGLIRTDSENIFTRSLMIADLKPDESVRLQKQGIGEGRNLGCGIFVPHKGIDAVYNVQE
jgi:CRISPR-associated protein Cas6